MIKIEHVPTGLSVKTPAKINLLLLVGDKRDDGYHEIFTLFQAVDLWDEIILEEAPAIEVISLHPDVPSGNENIMYRAAERLMNDGQGEKGARITLHKKIPVAAGLGGGSSDAAAVLSGLNILWRLNYSQERLISLSEEIGSDVPFFLNGPAALGLGRGEKIIPLRLLHGYYFVLIDMGIHISTSWAYSELSRHRKGKTGHITGGLPLLEEGWIGPYGLSPSVNFELTKMKGNIKIPLPEAIRIDEKQRLWINLFNDFEEVIIKRYSEINEIKKVMVACGAKGSLMSGSGSTVFGIFRDRRSAERACATVKEKGLRSWVVKALN